MKKESWQLSSAGDWLWKSEPMRWRRVYPGRGEQIQAARAFVKTLFAGTGREEDVAVVVSELAGNAIRHSRSGAKQGWFGLEVTLDEVSYIAVTDQGGGCVPALRSERPGCELPLNGRGLLVVSQLALMTGVHGSPQLGFTVWADIDMRARSDTGKARTMHVVS